ncbi:hypothetical protein AAHA92_16912 [Salvia divinorum]|uniref:Uncharacterized protein n=1 Tax=Salvia divinorum TaxID=28513 RepID=A0ABD1GXK3_SALDI
MLELVRRRDKSTDPDTRAMFTAMIDNLWRDMGASPPAQLLTLKLPFSPIQSNPSTVLRLLQLPHWRRHRRHSRPRRPFFQRRGFTVAIAFLAARRCRLYRVRPGPPPSPCVSAPTDSALGGLRFT